MSTTVHPKGSSGDSLFLSIINNLTKRIRGAGVPEQTTISAFKASYSSHLKSADDGNLQIISQGGKRYLLLSETQLVDIMGAYQHNKPRSLADTLASLKPPKERLDSSQVMLAGSEQDPFTLPESVR